ncbi:MAG: prolipoprotein diacylglyceryl transferase, partial [Spirochaetes bacterium]|nr:prolipoprotein diacylglyceryl transferase [Spirochaetota bacterium]
IGAGFYFVKKRGLPLLKMSDIVGVTIPLGLFFGRLGCLGYGCCYGNVCPEGFPLKIRFPAIGNKLIGYTPAFEKHLLEGLVTSADKHSAYIYPTQIISSINGLILFFILYILFRKKKFDGQIAGLSLMLYAVSRFLIELLRVEPHFLGLSVSQWIGVGMFAFGAAIYAYAKKDPLRSRS